MENKEVKGYKGYIMTYDLHTHTVYSHGKGSVRDNVVAAIEKGLSKIAVTDHGPGHLTYGMKRSSIPNLRREIEQLKAEFPQIEIYMSVEANIITKGAGLDVYPEEFKDYDFVIAGYHYGVLNGYCVENYIRNKIKGGNNYGFIESDRGFSKKLRIKNTDMALKALYENNIKILTHPGDKGPFDMLALAKACEETDTLMEISTWHEHLNEDEIKLAGTHTDVKFIISSDAHHPGRVGEFQGGIDKALKSGIDMDRIVNIKRV